MVNVICELYGDQTDIELDGEVHTFYNFPTLEQLYENRTSMEEELKTQKFGYRAAWIGKAVEKLTELGGRTWLEELKVRPYKEASETLINNFTGIGKKVI
jgi:3-methyladenine DNA glycosylase/8-oxoguanine DNA glycosylase